MAWFEYDVRIDSHFVLVWMKTGGELVLLKFKHQP